MSLNRSLLTQMTEDLKKKKKPSKPSVPRNQWQHPGEVTTIPGNNITMDGVSYSVMGVPDVGPPQMMYPDQQYSYPGASNVTEYPKMRMGGLLSRSVKCRNCGHSWKSTDGGADPLTCHKCGHLNLMKEGGWLNKFQEGGSTNGWTGSVAGTAYNKAAKQQPTNIDANAMHALEQVISYPQRKVTELITGKNQYPSQALGIKNPVLAFAADFALDPLNVLGLPTAVKTLGKLGKGAKNIAKVTKAIAKGEDVSKSTINWAKWNKEIPGNKPLLQEYKAIEQTSKANGSWMKNTDGSAFKGTPEQFVQQQSNNFKKAFPEGVTKAYRGAKGHIDDFANRKRNDYATFLTDNKANAETYADSDGGYKKYYHPDVNVPSEYTGPNGIYELGIPNDSPRVIGEAEGRNWRLLNYNDEIAKSTRSDGYAERFQKELLDNRDVYDLADYDPTKKYLSTDIYANYVKNADTAENIAEIRNVKDQMGYASDIPANTVYAVDANKVPLKSLRYNNGMFDLSNPNIYKSLVPALGAGAVASQFVDQKKNGGWLENYEGDAESMYALGGEMIRRADGSYSKRGLWDNIRANRGSKKKPTSEMEAQKRKITRQLGGQIIFQEGGDFVDLQKQYNIDPLSKIGIEKAQELAAKNPNLKFVCNASGCAQIASDAADAYGQSFSRNNAWDMGNSNNVNYLNPKYNPFMGKDGPLPDPTGYKVPKDVINASMQIVGLNRPNNLRSNDNKRLPQTKANIKAGMAPDKTLANDSYDYANRMLYPDNRGYEHVGFNLGEGRLLHGTGANSEHPAFYTIDNMKDGISLPGYGNYDPVETMSPSSFWQKGKALLGIKEEGGEEFKYGGHGGLDRWFAEKWVDVKTGKACGRKSGESRPGYPACRPSKRVNSDTPKTSGELSGAEKAKFKREKTSSERIHYNHKREEGGEVGWLDQYQDGGTKYKVKEGQYLSQIAKANNVSVDDLVMANQISNPNLIKPGQELVIPEGANQFRMPSKEGYVGFNELMTRQKELSALPARDMIRQYRKQNQMDGNYALVDKATGSMSIYNPLGEEVSTFPVGTGKDYGDKRTINVKGPNARNTTPAGIYTLTNKGSGRDSYAPHYGDNIWEMVDQNNMQQSTALHQVPNELPYRNSIIGDKNPTNNRITNGCINCRKKDFDTQVEKFMDKGSQIYVLPDDQNNKLVVKNNKIMLAGDKFDKDVSYSKRDLTATPLQIKWAKSQFGDAVDNVRGLTQSLVDNKQQLMKDLNIDNDTYNRIAGLSLGVAGQESDYGNSKKYKFKETGIGQFMVGQAKELKALATLNNPFDVSPNSRGLNQIKYNSQNKEVRNLFAKYGIKSQDDLADPKKSSVAATIMMSYMYNNELPQLKEQMKRQNIDPFDALLYLNQGKRGEITKGTATPDKNIYIKNVKNYANRFVLNQKSKNGGDAPQNNWLEKYN